MGGCNQSKVGPVPGGISGGMIKTPSFSFWKFFKNRRSMMRVAPAFPEDLTERSTLSTSKLPSPIPPCSRPCNSPSSTFSEVSLTRHMLIEDEADDEEMVAIEAAVHPTSPHLTILGPPLLAAKTSEKEEELQPRQESQEILRQLRDAGIVARPESRAGGLSYDFFVQKEEDGGLPRKPPARLRKLKRAKKIREAKGDARLRQEMESRMQMADERHKRAIEMVRFKQAKHLVLDVERARDISAQLEEDKIQAAAERLQHKEVISEVIQGRVNAQRRLHVMAQNHHHSEVRLRGALKKLAQRK